MTTIGKFPVSLVTLSLLQAFPASAAEIGALPPVQTQNGITYITGGIGQPESTAMTAAAGRYDVMLSFAERSGAYLAGVDVDIADRTGNRVLDIVSGPILLVDLPAGRYTVRADADGHRLVKHIAVDGRRHQAVAYTWHNNVEERSEFAAFEIRPMQSQALAPVQEAKSPDEVRYGGGLDHVSEGLWSQGFQNY